MGVVRRGIAPHLEKEADRLIRESLKGVTKHSAKSDILTPWKEADRYKREVYVASGTPDPATRRGMFHRVLNPDAPELNSRDGYAPPRQRGRMRGLATFVAEHGEPPEDYDE